MFPKMKTLIHFAKNVINHFGKVDVVINNAGITIGSFSALETTIEDYEKVCRS